MGGSDSELRSNEGGLAESESWEVVSEEEDDEVARAEDEATPGPDAPLRSALDATRDTGAPAEEAVKGRQLEASLLVGLAFFVIISLMCGHIASLTHRVRVLEAAASRADQKWSAEEAFVEVHGEMHPDDWESWCFSPHETVPQGHFAGAAAAADFQNEHAQTLAELMAKLSAIEAELSQLDHAMQRINHAQRRQRRQRRQERRQSRRCDRSQDTTEAGAAGDGNFPGNGGGGGRDGGYDGCSGWEEVAAWEEEAAAEDSKMTVYSGGCTAVLDSSMDSSGWHVGERALEHRNGGGRSGGGGDGGGGGKKSKKKKKGKGYGGGSKKSIAYWSGDGDTDLKGDDFAADSSENKNMTGKKKKAGKQGGKGDGKGDGDRGGGKGGDRSGNTAETGAGADEGECKESKPSRAVMPRVPAPRARARTE